MLNSLWKEFEEDKLPLVEYEAHGDEYVLYSIDPRVQKALPSIPFVYIPASKRFEAWVDTLPKSQAIELRKLRTKMPTDAEQKKFTALYKRYVAKKAVMEKMALEIEKDEEALVKMLDQFGFCLKPGSRDRRLLADDTLVHRQEAILASVDEEELRKLAKKHPELKKVFKEEVVERVDRAALSEALAALPGTVASRVMVHDSVLSFNERQIKKPEAYLMKLLNKVAEIKTKRKTIRISAKHARKT